MSNHNQFHILYHECDQVPPFQKISLVKSASYNCYTEPLIVGITSQALVTALSCCTFRTYGYPKLFCLLNLSQMI